MTGPFVRLSAIALALLLVVQTALCACRSSVAAGDQRAVQHCAACCRHTDAPADGHPSAPPACPHCKQMLSAERPTTPDLGALTFAPALSPIAAVTCQCHAVARITTPLTLDSGPPPLDLLARLHGALVL